MARWLIENEVAEMPHLQKKITKNFVVSFFFNAISAKKYKENVSLK